MNDNLKYYIGAKQIKAEPQERNGQPGYRVVYSDDYESWSPKEVFEKYYICQGNDPTRVTQEMVDNFLHDSSITRMGNHTVAFTKLANGFTTITDSACVVPENYDEEVGKKYATEKVKQSVWNYLGFLLAFARNGVK